MQTLKPIPKWNSGHFTPGTVVTFENVFCKVLPEEEREFEDQIYGYSKGTVTGCVSNGAGSYCIDHTGLTQDEDPMGSGGTNIDWVRYIHSRGPDSCAPKPSMSNDFIKLVTVSNGDKTRQLYHVYSLRELTAFILHSYDSSAMHLYDFDVVMEKVVADPMVIASKLSGEHGFPSYRISKRKLAKLVKRVMPRCRISVKSAARREAAIMDAMYAQDFSHDYEYS